MSVKNGVSGAVRRNEAIVRVRFFDVDFLDTDDFGDFFVAMPGLYYIRPVWGIALVLYHGFGIILGSDKEKNKHQQKKTADL